MHYCGDRGFPSCSPSSGISFQQGDHGVATLFLPAVFRTFLPYQIQGCFAPLILRLNVSAGLLNQKPDRFQMAICSRLAQRCLSIFILRLDIGTGLLYQKHHCFQIANLGCPGQRCLSIFILSLDTGTSLFHQKHHCFQMAKFNSVLKWSSAIDGVGVDLEVFQVYCNCVGHVTFLRSPLPNQI